MKSQSPEAKAAIESSIADLGQALQLHDLVLSKVDVEIGRDAGNYQGRNLFGQMTGGDQPFQSQQGHTNRSQFGQERNGRIGGFSTASQSTVQSASRAYR